MKHGTLSLNGLNHIGHSYLRSGPGEAKPSLRAACGVEQAGAYKRREQLRQVRLG